MKNYQLAILAVLVAIIPLARCDAQTIQLGPDNSSILSSRNVGGGLSYTPDGDILAFTRDASLGPVLYRYDVNGDGFPALGKQLLAQFAATASGSFVQVAPGGGFALFGITGSADFIYKVDLLTNVSQKIMTSPGNFDLTFIDDAHAYLSAFVGGSNEISYLELGSPPVATVVARIGAGPAGPLAVNSEHDLYVVKSGTELLRFSSGQLNDARANSSVLTETQSAIHVPVSGGADMTFHPTSSDTGELYATSGGGKIFRIREESLIPETFATVIDSTSPALTAVSFFEPSGGSAGPELAASLSVDFGTTFKLLQIRSATNFVDLGTGEDGLCKSDTADCLHQPLRSSACVGANGFLSQINIASVINLQIAPLNVQVEYFDLSGILRGQVQTNILANAKQDFIINDLGLAPDTIGTVCVTTDGASGSWTGGIALYKPDLRNGTPAFGDAFDFALYYPFLNAFTAPVTVPLNTYHLGTNPAATVANWIAIIDADRDGAPLTGTLLYYNDRGELAGSEPVSVPDGGRRDLAGHVGVGGTKNQDAIGMAQFVPNPKPGGSASEFYMTVTRYFYDCPGSSCNNFLTAFNLPYRPGTRAAVLGGTSTASGEISIIELNNVASDSAVAGVSVFAENGALLGSPQVAVPARGTRHLILNKSGQDGFLAASTAASSEVKTSSGSVSASSLFYKLNQFGVLEYAYAAPFASSPGLAQVSQFNSFISQQNVPEVFNSGALATKVNIDFYSYTGARVAGDEFVLAPNGTHRLSSLAVPPNDYGTIVIQSSESGLAGRNFVRRNGQYVLPFGAE